MPDIATRDIATRDIATRDIATRDVNASGTTDFVFTMTTTGAAETVTIPCQNVGTFNAEIDWGDGDTSTITAYNDADLAHEYADAGDHEIRISGTFPNIYFNNTGDCAKLKSVSNLGVVGWATFYNAFYGCSNITSFTAGNTDTSAVTSMYGMFRDCASLTSADLSGLDTSSVTSMSLLFNGCTNLTSIDVSSFDTSLVTSFAYAFNSMSNYIGPLDLSHFDTSSAVQLNHMFRSSNKITVINVTGWDTSNVTDMRFVFDASGITDIVGVEDFDVSAIVNTNNMVVFFHASLALPTARYDEFLVNLAAQTVLSGLAPGFGSSTYTSGGAAEAARTSLINDDSWTITDGGAA